MRIFRVAASSLLLAAGASGVCLLDSGRGAFHEEAAPWRAGNRRWRRRCCYLFDAVFVAFQVLQPCSKRAGRIVILFDTSHGLGNERASIGEIGFGADTMGIANAGKSVRFQFAGRGRTPDRFELWGKASA